MRDGVRWGYTVMPYLIGWVHTQIDPCKYLYKQDQVYILNICVAHKKFIRVDSLGPSDKYMHW